MVRPAALAFLTLALAGCGRGHEAAPAPPATIAAAAGPGAEIKLNSGDLFITAILPSQSTDEDYVGEVGALAKRTAQAMQAGAADFPAGVTSVSFLALRPDLDRLGNAGAHSFMMVSLKAADLQAAHLDRLGAYGVLDLVTMVQVVLPYGGAVDAWCAQHDRAPSFCALAKASSGQSGT